jgi:hypothetical protein
MKQRILAVAVLTGVCGLAQADDISNVNAAGSVDIFQVASTITTGGTLDVTTTATNEVNVILGNGADNTIGITQASGTSIANVLVNAQLPDDANTGLGNRLTGHVADSSVAAAGAVGSTYDATTTDGGNTNVVALTQNNAGDVANISVDGSANNLTVSQSNDGAVLNMTLHGTGTAYTIAQ